MIVFCIVFAHIYTAERMSTDSHMMDAQRMRMKLAGFNIVDVGAFKVKKNQNSRFINSAKYFHDAKSVKDNSLKILEDSEKCRDCDGRCSIVLMYVQQGKNRMDD